MKKKQNINTKNFIPYILIGVVMIFTFYYWNNVGNKVNELNYNVFIS